MKDFLDAPQLSLTNFYSDSGTTFLGTGGIDSSGYVNAAPEPSTCLLLALALVTLAARGIRNRVRLQ